MKTIIAGSRSVQASEFAKALNKCKWSYKISKVLCGGAKGADLLGKQWAEKAGLKIEMYEPDWKSFGKAAGPMRNKEMARNAEALLAIWDGVSRGTISMINLAKHEGLRIFIYNIPADAVEEHLPHEHLHLR